MYLVSLEELGGYLFVEKCCRSGFVLFDEMEGFGVWVRGGVLD